MLIVSRATGLLVLFLAPAARAQLQGEVMKPAFETAPYDVLTNNRVEVTNLMLEPQSGIATDSDGRIYAVNPPANFVVVYGGPTPVPELVVPTANGPVSVAIWEPTEDPADRKILVVCRGNHVATLHDAQTGEIDAVARLDSEPGDVKIDEENDWAFVSCAQANTVVLLDLASMQVIDRFDIQCGVRPGALYLDPGAPDVADDTRVYVVGSVTGNNSTFRRLASDTTVGHVLDLDGNPGGELPDQDVCRINPFDGTVQAAVRGSGSLHFAIERHPSGELWILSTDSNNKGPLDTEPAVRGQIVVNQLVRVVEDPNGMVQAPSGKDLDDITPGTPEPDYDPARSVNQARTMAIHRSGLAFVASPLSDVMIVLNNNGNRIGELALPPHAQCYSVELWPADDRYVLALCLGTMTVEAYYWPTQTPVASLPLLLDPTPDEIRLGRDIFLDGQRSQDGRSSCAACHPGGESDMLGWSIAGVPCDIKDVMVTQHLKAIKDSYPHHWRGERDLFDFIGAFAGLLGSPPEGVPEPEVEALAFVAFLRSLEAQPNGRQNPRRIVDDAATPDPSPNGLVGFATDGQEAFQTIPNFNGNTCAECHSLETGGNGNLFAEFGSDAPRAIPIEVAHLRHQEAKGFKAVNIDLGDGNGTVEVNREGFGTAHNGSVATLFRFIEGFDLGDIVHANIFAFLLQMDQGNAPGTAWAERWTQASPASVRRNVRDILLEGAQNGWLDMVAFGRHDHQDGNGLQPERWWFDRRQGVFVSEDPAVSPITWLEMAFAVENGLAEHLFLGVPPENGRRIGIDFDNDGLVNGLEEQLGTDPLDPDTDGDGWWDGHEHDNGDDPLVAQMTSNDSTAPTLLEAEVDFSWVRGAKVHVRTSEDCTYHVDYGPAGGPTFGFDRRYFSRQDTCVLTTEIGSTPTQPALNYAAEITLTDRNGNVTGPLPLPSFAPDEVQVQQGLLPFLRVESMEWIQQDRVGDTLDAQVRIKVAFNFFGPSFVPSPDQMIFCSLSLHDAATDTFVKSTNFTTSLATEFQFLQLDGTQVDYDVTPGKPWIVSPLTDANGETVIDFQQPGLTPGQTVKLSITGILKEATPGSVPPVFGQGSSAQYQPTGIGLEKSAVLKLEF